MAWSSVTNSAALTLDQNYEFITDGTDAIVITPNPREIVSMVFNVDHDGSGTDRVQIQILGGHRISNGNGLDGATAANDLELDTLAGAPDDIAADDDLNGVYLIMTSGGERGEGRLIIDSVAADDGVLLSHALSGTPSTNDTYALYRFGIIDELEIDIADPAEDEPNTAPVVVTGWPYVAVVARMSGGTNAPDIRMAYATDGVSAT